MKKMFIVLGIVIASLAIIVIVVLAWHGFFSTPKVSEQEMGPYSYVYDEYVGEYKNTGPVFEKVYKALQAQNISSTIGIGIYLDDPAQVPANQLRSQCGSVYDIKDSAKVAELKNFKLGSLQRQRFIVVEFPTKTSFSYMIGPAKCYPALTKYANEKGYGMAQPYEVYDMPGKMTYYIMPIVIK